MGKLNRSMIYRGFQSVLLENCGATKTNAIWDDCEELLTDLLKEYSAVGSDEKMMVLPLYALYRSMQNHGVEDTLDLLLAYGEQMGDRLAAMIGKVTSIPGVSKLLWRNMPALMRMTSDPKKGYQRRIVSETSELVGVDILTCPLYEMTKKLGAPEICSVVCLIDKGQMMGFRHIDYTRTKALGDGDPYCDYRLRYDENKK